jgi:hypothetical protein
VSWSGVLVTGGSQVGPQVPQQGGVLLVGVSDPVAFGDAVHATGVQHLVVVVPAALDEPARTALTLTQFRWPQLRIARVVSDHAPLALCVALTLARRTVTQAGLAPAFVEAFTALCWSGAWTPSVAKLVRPAPSMGQYLRSLVPGGSFVVGLAPEGTVGASNGIPAARPDLSRTLLVGGSGVPATTAAGLATRSGATSVRPYPIPGDWTAVFGTARATQLALVPNDPGLARVSAVGGCPGCGQSVGSTVCPYCHIQTRPLVAAGAAALVGTDQGATE